MAKWSRQTLAAVKQIENLIQKRADIFRGEAETIGPGRLEKAEILEGLIAEIKQLNSGS